MAKEHPERKEGKVLVEFDLREDILKPLQSLDTRLGHLSVRMDEHVQAHEEEVAKRAARRAQLLSAVKWAVGAVLSLGLSVLAAHLTGAV